MSIFMLLWVTRSFAQLCLSPQLMIINCFCDAVHHFSQVAHKLKYKLSLFIDLWLIPLSIWIHLQFIPHTLGMSIVVFHSRGAKLACLRDVNSCRNACECSVSLIACYICALCARLCKLSLPFAPISIRRNILLILLNFFSICLCALWFKLVMSHHLCHSIIHILTSYLFWASRA